MGISVAGLASTMAGYQQGQRQAIVDESNARKDQRDQWQYDQEKKAQEAKARSESILQGEDAGLASAPAQTNGSRLVDSAAGLFSAKPPAEQSAAPVEEKSIGTDGKPVAGLASVAPAQPASIQPAKTPDPYYKQMQARLDAYAAKNPHDIDAITSAQAKIDAFAKTDADRAHSEFVKNGESAVQKFIASGGMDTAALDELTSKHFPDGHAYATEHNADGTYTVTQTDTGVKGKPMTFDELGAKVSNLLHPDIYMAAHAKAQQEGLVEGAKLPSQVALDKAKTANEITKADKTGVAGKNNADAVNSRSQAELNAAKEDLIRSGDSNGILTLTQQRSNAEIEAARNAIAGLSPDEIALRTARATNTGRENPDFDPNLAKQAALATRRKIGNDDLFDKKNTEISQSSLLGKSIDNWSDKQLQKMYGGASSAGKAKIDAELMRRQFKSDPAMAGHTLGELTPKGYAVLDKTGKLIGHYAK